MLSAAAAVSCRRARCWAPGYLLRAGGAAAASAAGARGASTAALAARPSTRTVEEVARSARGPSLAPVRLGRRVAVVLR